MAERPDTATGSARDWLERALDPGWADTAGDAACLVVDGSGPGLAAEDLARLAGWYRRQPLPLVGLALEPASPLGRLVDVHAADARRLDTLLVAIGANPIAAAVLVQVLRATEGLATEDALAVESLGYGALQSGGEFARWLAARQPRTSRDATGDGAGPVRIERQGGRLEVTLDSPSNRNALSVAMRDGLTDAFRLVAMDESIDEVGVRGNGPCFSAGGDLTEFGSSADPTQAHQIRLRRMPARFLALAGGRYHFHLHGACVGAGIELPAFAGRITARGDSYFVLPEVAMGLIPGAGGCVSIPRRIGRQRTAWMAITGEAVSADLALAWGLVNALTD